MLPADVIQSLSGDSFCGGSRMAAGGGTYGHVQLWNPAASGVKLFVDWFSVSTSVQQWWHFGGYHTALTTNTAHAANINLGGAAPKAEVRTEANAATLITNILSAWLHCDIFGNRDVPLRRPVVVDEGEGLIIVGGLGTSTSAIFCWRELPA